MEIAGLVAVSLASVAGVVTLAGYVFEQVPPLAEKATMAIRSLRALRQELKQGHEERR
jgi:hypothetical protein